MNPSRHRLTLMQVMIAVAFAAMLCSGWMFMNRRADRFYGSWRAWSTRMAREQKEVARGRGSAAKLDYYFRLQRKYRQAYDSPWLPVEADPREPE